MGCFLGCFCGEKNHKRCAKRTSPQIQQRNRVHHEIVSTAEEIITDTLVAEFRNKPMEEEKLSPSPRKRVAFSSKIETYEHVIVSKSIESLVEFNEEVGKENQCDLKATVVGLFPPNHRYHNARESDDEAEVYGDSDLEILDEDDYEDYNEHISSSTESNRKKYAINEEVESRITLKIQPPRDRSDHIDYVVNSIENITQSKVVDASLSNWLNSPGTMLKETSSSGLDDSTSMKNFED
ncbi:hypothetical protein ACS0TY_025330 [Phlomoides rotata]